MQNQPALFKDHHKIFAVQPDNFDQLALEIFRYQATINPVYSAFVQALGIEAGRVARLEDIPFLPVRFFKDKEIISAELTPQQVFESSGTNGMQPSKHMVADLSIYERSFTLCFEQFFGPVNNWCVIGLLPSYLETPNSSLVYMTEKLISLSKHPDSGFYLDDQEALAKKLSALEKSQQPVWLIGVSFALLDLAEKHSMKLQYTQIIETGGMKGRREEWIRPALHARLSAAFQKEHIYSEYGMTELLSQAYSTAHGIFRPAPWMKILLRDEEDPFHILRKGRGTINVIDLANIHSCSFIAVDDSGILYEDGSFEVLGRTDGSDLRGCSLLIV